MPSTWTEPEAAFTAKVATSLRATRLKHKLSQPAAAEIAGLSERQYKDYELGSVRVSLYPIWRLATHYRLPLDQLTSGR